MQRLLTGTSEMSKPQGTVQDSDLQENATATKPNAEGKLLCLVGSRNAKSLGSSSSKKAGNRNVPQNFQKTIVLPAAPLRKLKPKQEFVASEKHELFSIVSCNDVKSPGSSSSKKTGKRNMPGDFQKAIDLPAAPLRKQKPNQKFIASEKLELFTKGSFNDAKSPDNSTSRKAGKRNMPEDFQTAIVLPPAPQKKLKLNQEFVASEKHELFSTGSCNDAKSLGSGTSRKSGKWQKKPEDFEKSSVSCAAPQKKLKLEQDLVALEKHGVFSLGGYSNAKPPGSSFSRNAGKWHKPEDVEKSSVPPAAPQKKLKLVQVVASEKHGVAKPPGSTNANKVGELHKPEGIQKACVLPDAPPRKQKDSVALEKNELFSFVSCSNAKVLDSISSKKAYKQREHEVTQKPIALPTAPQTILKQPNKTSSSIKAVKHHKPERYQKTIVQPALSQSKLEQSNRIALERQKANCVAPERQRTRSKTRKFAREKEYAVISVWQNIYESEGSSGSTEPLVNKRTERRKRERERLVQITYSRSRKRSTSGISSIKTQPPEEGSSQQAKPPSLCLDIIVIDPADHVVTQTPVDQSQPPAPCLDVLVIPPADQVMTQAPGDQSQPPAPCSVATDQVVLLQSADSPGLIPSNPSSIPDVIDISDDD